MINTFGSNHFGFADKHMLIRGWEIHLSKMQGPSTSVNFLTCLVVWACLRYSFLRGAQLLILSRGSGLHTGSGNWFITLRKDLDKIPKSFAVRGTHGPPSTKKETQILVGLFGF